MDSIAIQQARSPDEPVVLVHGGAWNIPEDLRAAHVAGTAVAYRAALDALSRSDEPLDAVVAALVSMEDDPTFDAGTGSFLDEDGRVCMDAAIMRGSDLAAGAVAAIGRFPNPSRIARAVMECTEHVFLIGEGAERFAIQRGFKPVDPRSLVLPREFEGYEAWIRAGRPDARTFFDEEGSAAASGRGSPQDRRGTVGIVLAGRPGPDGRRPLFAGISTGGTRGKMAGRVGDAPLIGCGLYADDEGAAVCCTGWGEAFIRSAAAKSVSDSVARGSHPQDAVESTLMAILRRTGGRGGIIALAPDGRTGAAFTTPDMAFAGQTCVKLEV
ncbi:MAG: isoaspartyl peptidase/L-asparaginase [Spirochaetes bacterium]|nr:isoaspartyl peptidase/L-asparaginase [Spirochaetota bacterium]